MSSPACIIAQPVFPETLFPALDTAYRPPVGTQDTPTSKHASQEDPKRVFKKSIPQVPSSDLKTEQSAIFESYARFIAAFTGRDEVAFHASFQSHALEPAKRAIISARILENAAETQVEFGVRRSALDLTIFENGISDVTLDFAIQIGLGHAVSHDTLDLETPFTLIINSPNLELVLHSEEYSISDKDALQIFDAALSYLYPPSSSGELFESRTSVETHLERSTLNFPPLSRPPALVQDGESQGQEPKALLHAAFERRVLEHPDRIALDFLQSQQDPSQPKIRRTFTYAVLNELTTLLAERILACAESQGVRPRSAVVPVLLSTSAELYISYLAVLKAGLAFCPLPVEAPPQRLLDILEDLKPQVILGAEVFRECLPKSLYSSSTETRGFEWIDVEAFTIRELGTVSNHPTALRVVADPQENDVAYVMYTSGSTGKPKGVQISHLASSCSIAAHAVFSPLPNSPDGVPRWFQFAAPTFDPSLMEIFVTLSTGATLCSASRDLTLTDLETTVSEVGASVMMATPSMAALIRRSRIPSLQSLWTMGETLLRKNIDEFAQSSRDLRTTELVNAYGPTEASINCTLLPNFHPGDRGSIIGPALSTSSLFVIDPSAKLPTPVPRGFPGELAIGGNQVSIGYINRPEQNEKSFVTSPEFGRLYRTGDKVRIVTDRQGQHVLEFLGRLDTSQVKLSGRRVDLDEIDTIIASTAGVKEAVTVAYKRDVRQHGSEEAVTFLVSEQLFDKASTEAACRETAAHQLPPYMCPSKYFFLSQIPRSLAGKVDRKALSAMVGPLWHEEAARSQEVHINGTKRKDIPTHPNTASDVEILLREILVQLVGAGTAEINPSTNFFSVGIDSLRAIRYLQEARDAGVTELSIVDVLRGATPQSLAQIVIERRQNLSNRVTYADGEDSSSQSSNDTPNEGFEWDEFRRKYEKFCAEHLSLDTRFIDRILPTTATQSGMLASFLRSSAFDRGSQKHYIHHSIHHINESIDIPRLQESWLSVLDRHEAYRMVFLPVDDRLSPFVQCVLSSSCPLAQKSWNMRRCETDDHDSLDEAMKASLLTAENSIVIDKPPFYLTLITTPARTFIVVSIFHGIFDGASLQLLFDEVTSTYYGAETPRRSEISTAVDMHYDSDGQKAIDFWSAQLKDCDPMPFPSLTGLRPETITRIPKTSTILATSDLEALREGAKRSLASPLAILQAAWSLLLVTYKDSLSSSTFGSVISGRLDEESEVCVGPTFTTVPVTAPTELLPESGLSNAAVLQHFSQVNALALEHLQIPLNAIVAPNGGLYYDTLLAWQDFASGAKRSDLWHTVDYPAMGNDFAVMIEVWPESNGALRLRATYTDEHLDEPSASLMLQQFNDIVTFIIQNPETPYLDSRFVTKLSYSPLATSSASFEDRHELLHAPFEENAKINPDDVALIFKSDLQSELPEHNVEWTYAELDQKANRLAHYLVSRFGRLSDKVVPFCLEKSPELYVAILGILKTGAAWCPIDPAFPTSRRHDLIARTDANMLLVANNTASQEDMAVPREVVVVDINDLSVESLDASDEVLELMAPCPQNMAYLIWTSGTTGLPKGVQVQHNSAAISMRSLRNYIARSQNGTVRMLQFSQPTFDVFVQDLFYTWGLRGTVISATKDIMLGAFASLSNQTKASHAHLTPAFATIIPRRSCQTLEVVTFIGEALPQAVADDWGQDMIAYNTYGPAEVSVVSTVRQFAGCSNDFKSTNVGFTLPSVAAFVVNDDRVITKNGVGELALAGPQVARGYWKDPEKTQEKFLWNKSANSHVYLTGDVVRQLHDGSFEFVGRRDDLVKLNGMRVELSEISFALSNCHRDVEQVVTMHMARSDRPAKVVVVFLSVPRLSSTKTNSAIEGPIVDGPAVDIANSALVEARRNLPDHMVPSVFIVVKNIPVTASAKIDRKALSQAYETLDLDMWENKMSPVEASTWTDKESLLVQHISSFSGIAFKSIGKTSRLAALGIDSIGAIRLTARLKSEGYAASTAALLQCRTVADICALLVENSSNPAQIEGSKQILEDFNAEWFPAVSEHLKDGVSGTFVVCPPLPLQENLLSESFKNYESYWSNHFFDLAEDVNLDTLLEAWRTIASHTEALRVGFLPTAAVAPDSSAQGQSSTFIQIVYDTATVDWDYVKVGADEFALKCKAKAKEIAFNQQENSFLQPCWAVTVFDRGDSKTMMFSVHHSIHDGPSLQFIIEDLYNAYTRSSPASTRHQLRDAIAISSTFRTKQEEDEVFWEAVLKDFAAEEENMGQVAVRKPTGYNIETIASSVSYASLQAAAQQLETSVTSILRTAWSCMVADLLEVSDKNIVIGEVLSERRMDAVLDDVIGPLVSTIPAPVFAFGSTREILARQDQAAAWQHRHVSPGTIRRLIKRPKGQALYPAVFVFHPGSSASECNSGNDRANLWTETEDHIGLNVEEDLTLNVEQRLDGNLDLVVSAEKSVLSLDRVTLLAKQLDALIAAMIAFPDDAVADLTNHFPIELISRSTPRIQEVPDVVSYENPLCWLEHYARITPDWSAVEVAESIGPDSTPTVSWSYAQLNEEGSRVQAFIESHDVRGRMIGMCLGRTLASFAIIVGIFKSGNTYLPIDEDLPGERKAFLLQDSNAAIFFTTGSVSFAPEGCKVVNVEKDQYQSTSELTQKFPRNKVDPAYLLYTSGSTGNPKGVLISSGNLSAFVEAISEFICASAPITNELGGVGKYLALASRAFDVHLAEMFLAWRWGFSCVTATRSTLLDDLQLAINELKVTHASFVPSLLDQIGLVPADVPSLKYLGVGGEKISQRTLETWGNSDDVTLVNAYGPTEATIGCAAARVSSSSSMRNVGQVFGDTIAHVLIPGTLTYAKRGMEGELCVTGSLVGIGYHNRDTGAFVENFHGSKMYRTGDLVRLMADESIEIFGRSDDQTKIRGQRLELGEVSECVRTLCPDGADVSTLITKHPDLSRLQLVSFVAYSKSTTKDEKAVPLDTFEETNSTIRSGCKERLPAYMVPDVVIPLSFLPLAAMSGKADVKRLKAIFASIPLRMLLADNGPSSTSTTITRELNEDEKFVVEILKGVVRGSLSDIRPSTNIFEIGVDSLVAISLSTRLRKSGYNCSVADILSIATVEELALLPRTSSPSDRAAADQALAREKLAQVEAKYRLSSAGEHFGEKAAVVRPCLPVQEAVVARSFNQDSGTLYVNHLILELTEDVVVSKLRDAWEASAKENEILRTCFCQVENDILQVVLTNDAFQLSWEEHVSPASDTLPILKDMRDDIAKDIMEKIQELPPMRIHLLRSASSNTRPLICLSLHHALYDAESLTLLMEDVYLRYESQEIPNRPSAGALVEYVASQNQQEAQKYWTKALQDYIPPETQTGDMIGPDEAKVSERLLKSSLSSLESCASRLRVTLPSLAQAIFALAFAKANSVNDLVFGLVLSGRSVPVPGIEALLAPTITTVPQRIDMRRGDATTLDILSSIQKSSGHLLQFQHTSLRAVHRWVKADRPLFNCLLSYLKTGGQPSYSQIWKEVDSYMPPDYPFAVEFEARAPSDDLIMRAVYTPEFGSQAKVENLLEMMELLIETISKGDTFTVKSLGIQGNEGHNSLATNLLDDSQEFSAQELRIKEILLNLGDLESELVSRNSTFFRLGIDSVIAIRFAQRLRAAGLAVSSSDISRYPSIALLSQHLSKKNQDLKKEEVPPPKTQDFDFEEYREIIPLLTTEDHVSHIYACTPLQTGLLTQTVANGGRLYVHHPTFQLASEVDISHLNAAWTSVVECHDILRTTFHYVENSEVPWIAAVHERPSISWSETVAEESVEQSVKQLVESRIFPSTDSFSNPPVQATIIRSSSANFLVFSIHHSLYDGWSLPLIFDALSTAYSQGLQPPKVPFFQAAKLITQNQTTSVKFWLDRLDNYEGTSIPASVPQGPNTTSFSRISIGMPTSEALNKCKAMDINLQSAALLAYAKALCSLVKRRDIVFGHVVSGRSLPLEDVEQIVGPLFNTIPYRVRFENPLLSNQDLVSQVQQSVVQGQAHQHASLNTIQRLWRQNNQGSDDALIDALFVFQKSAPASNVPTKQLWQGLDMEDVGDATEYALNFEIEQGIDVITLNASSPAGRLSHQDLETLCRSFDSILRDILDSPSRSVTAHPEILLDLPLSIKVNKHIDSDFQDIAESPALPVIRAALSEVSEIPQERITLQTSIYALGIDSIAAIRVGSICRRQDIRISVADVLQGRSLGGIVRLVVSKSAAIPVPKDGVQDIATDEKSKVLAQLKYFPESSVEQVLPCLAGQVYHLASWLKSGRTTYEPTWTFVSDKKFNVERLQSAWRTLQQRHPILRTIFLALGPHKTYQIILKPTMINDANFETVQSTATLMDAVKKEVRISAAQPATLFTPPISLRVIQGESQDAVLVKFHHSLYDAWTMGSLVSELSALYLNQTPSPSPSFPDFVWHVQNATSIAEEEAYWKSSLSNAERTILKSQTPEDNVMSQPTLKQTFVWIKEGVKGLKEMTIISRNCGLALSTIVVLAFGRALGQQTQTTNPTFGFFQVGRSASFPDTARLSGPCVNLLPITTSFAKAQSDLELALAIQEDLGERVPYEQSHLRKVLAWREGSDTESEFTPEPFFNASLNLLWHGKQAAKEAQAVEPLLKPLNIGVPTDFASEEAIPGETAIDELDAGYLASQNLFCDVGPVEETDSIDFGVKCDYALMEEVHVRAFVKLVTDEIVKIIGSLPRSASEAADGEVLEER